MYFYEGWWLSKLAEVKVYESNAIMLVVCSVIISDLGKQKKEEKKQKNEEKEHFNQNIFIFLENMFFFFIFWSKSEKQI